MYGLWPHSFPPLPPLPLLSQVAYDYFQKHPSRLKLFLGGYSPSLGRDIVEPYVPDPKGVLRAKSRVALRVRLVAGLLRLLGKGREAEKLQIGFRQCERVETLVSVLSHQNDARVGARLSFSGEHVDNI